jgi:hypothetical protein
VKRVVAHNKGRIKFYEVWNEPPNGTANAPASDYAKVVIAAYEAAKEADPNCMVGIAAKSVHVTYLDQAIAAGAKDHFDYITLHPYEVLGYMSNVPGSEQLYWRIGPTIRKMLAARNPAKINVPIIFTEVGVDTRRGEDRQAAAVVKGYILGAAGGIKCIQWYEGMDGDSGPLGLLRADTSERPAYRALGEMIRLVGQKPKYVGWTQLKDKHFVFVFEGPKGMVAFTWAGTREDDEVDFGESVTMIDALTCKASEGKTATLTYMPIMIENAPAGLVAKAKVNVDKPLPWGGDVSDAKSVSITLGKEIVEKGIHTRAGEKIAADVLAYGGSARAGDTPGGITFVVDANFLNYTATPIEISVQVRRSEKGGPGTLVLEYESTEGYKKAKAFEVPEKDEWSTATWRIDDSQFVSTWAYNFRFDKGAYAIQSVTVTKVEK